MDNEGGNGGGRSGRTLLGRIIAAVLGAMLLIVVVQLILVPAERRPKVVCYPLYKLGMFTIVTIPQYAAPDSPALALRNMERMDRFYGSCKAFVEPISRI